MTLEPTHLAALVTAPPTALAPLLIAFAAAAAFCFAQPNCIIVWMNSGSLTIAAEKYRSASEWPLKSYSMRIDIAALTSASVATNPCWGAYCTSSAEASSIPAFLQMSSPSCSSAILADSAEPIFPTAHEQALVQTFPSGEVTEAGTP